MGIGSADSAQGARLPATAIDLFHGPRAELLPLFEEADDSRTQIDEYLELGEVLVARSATRIVGHVQLVDRGPDCEIASVAVDASHRQRGIGRALVLAALNRAFAAGASRVLVGTAAADIGNLRFYQRLGFRMDRVERDAFRPERGYPVVDLDGIALRDRIWFSLDRPDSG